MNHKMGHVEKANMNTFSFDAQYLTFHNFGYAANPSRSFDPGDEVIQSTENKQNHDLSATIHDKPGKKLRRLDENGAKKADMMGGLSRNSIRQLPE